MWLDEGFPSSLEKDNVINRLNISLKILEQYQVNKKTLFHSAMTQKLKETAIDLLADLTEKGTINEYAYEKLIKMSRKGQFVKGSIEDREFAKICQALYKVLTEDYLSPQPSFHK